MGVKRRVKDGEKSLWLVRKVGTGKMMSCRGMRFGGGFY